MNKPIKAVITGTTGMVGKYINWLFPVGRALYPSGFCSLQELTAALLEVTVNGDNKHAINGKYIIALAKDKI